MDWDIVEGNWMQYKGKIKMQWGKLTDDHLKVIAGKRVALIGKIQEIYGITRDDAELQIMGFEVSNKDFRLKNFVQRDWSDSESVPRYQERQRDRQEKRSDDHDNTRENEPRSHGR